MITIFFKKEAMNEYTRNVRKFIDETNENNFITFTIKICNI